MTLDTVGIRLGITKVILAFALAWFASPATANVAPPSSRETRSRPLMLGTVESRDTADGHCRIWYALDGPDALTSLAQDEDPVNGVPDVVDAVEDGLARVWGLFVDDLGWRAPGSDDGAGGDDRLDVYLVHLDYNGLATPEWHDDHWATFLQVEPELASLGTDTIGSVAAHELHHAIEYSYSVETATWVYESSATYAQYRAFSESAALTAALHVLWGARIEDPGMALDTTGDRVEYAAFTWIKFLVDRAGGDLAMFQAWWEIIAETPDWPVALDVLATDLGLEDAAALQAEFGVWLYHACGRNDGQHWLDDELACLLDIEEERAHGP